jgi:hypothetical protein
VSRDGIIKSIAGMIGDDVDVREAIIGDGAGILTVR